MELEKESGNNDGVEGEKVAIKKTNTKCQNTQT